MLTLSLQVTGQRPQGSGGIKQQLCSMSALIPEGGPETLQKGGPQMLVSCY